MCMSPADRKLCALNSPCRPETSAAPGSQELARTWTLHPDLRQKEAAPPDPERRQKTLSQR